MAKDFMSEESSCWDKSDAKSLKFRLMFHSTKHLSRFAFQCFSATAKPSKTPASPKVDNQSKYFEQVDLSTLPTEMQESSGLKKIKVQEAQLITIADNVVTKCHVPDPLQGTPYASWIVAKLLTLDGAVKSQGDTIKTLVNLAKSFRYLDVTILVESFILDTLGLRSQLASLGFQKSAKNATLAQIAYLWTMYTDNAFQQVVRRTWNEKFKQLNDALPEPKPSILITTELIDQLLGIAHVPRNQSAHSISVETGPRLVIGLPFVVSEFEAKYGDGSGKWIENVFEEQIRRQVITK